MRALLGDYGLEDPSDPDYSNAVLNQHINMALALINDDSLDSVEVAEVPPSEGIPGTPADWAFTTDLPRGKRAAIALKAARTVIAPEGTDFAYKTPVHSVTRKGGAQALRLFIDQALVQLEGRRLAIATQTDLEAILGYPARFLSDLQEAYDTVSRIV